MLSDAEQLRLSQIERGLQVEDPQFVERFDHVIQCDPRRRYRMTARGWLIAAALIMGLAVLMASGAMAVIALSVAGVSAALWLTDHIGSADGRRPSVR